MNKKIAILVSAVALSSFGVHAQARAGAAGGRVGVSGAQAGAGGQVNAGGPVNGQINSGPVNGQINSGQINPPGQVNGQVNAGAQGNAGLVNGNAQGNVATPPGQPPGDRPPGRPLTDAQINGGGQGNVAAPPAAPGDRPPGRPLTGAQNNGTKQDSAATPPGPPGERPPGRPLVPGDQTTSQNGQFNTTQTRNNPNQPATNSNRFSSGVTNQFQPSSDGFSGNPSANQGGLTPTSRDPRIRRLYATNGAAANAAANAASASQDVAATPFDRNMAASLHQRMRVQGITPSAATDVHFTTSGGQVTLVGSVPTAQDKAKIVSVIQSSPGVVGVTDQLTVAGSGAAASGTATDQPAPANNAAPVPNP